MWQYFNWIYSVTFAEFIGALSRVGSQCRAALPTGRLCLAREGTCSWETLPRGTLARLSSSFVPMVSARAAIEWGHIHSDYQGSALDRPKRYNLQSNIRAINYIVLHSHPHPWPMPHLITSLAFFSQVLSFTRRILFLPTCTSSTPSGWWTCLPM